MTHSFKTIILYLFVICTSIFAGCSVQNIFYQPDRNLYSTPQAAGLAFEPVRFKSLDGTNLTGWFIPATGYQNPKNAKGTIIHFHGNAQNMSAHWEFVSGFPKRGYNVFVFDYRGYGASNGEPNPKGVYEDSDAAVSYVRGRADIDPSRLLVFGQSLGGTNAIAVVGAGNNKGVAAIAIESTFYSYSAIASDKVSGAGVLMSDTYSAEKYIDKLSPIPLLLIHGTSDRVIPFEHGQRLFAKAKVPKIFIKIEGGEHIEALTPRFKDEYLNAVIRFFDDAVKGK
jgi:fermentation-respiration switch protein FrsA (DUF1100 family)